MRVAHEKTGRWPACGDQSIRINPPKQLADQPPTSPPINPTIDPTIKPKSEGYLAPTGSASWSRAPRKFDSSSTRIFSIALFWI